MPVEATLDLPVDIDLMLAVGKWLAALAGAVLVLTLVNVWRRDSFPEVSYGEITLSHRRLRWLWFGALIGSAALGAAEDPIANRARTMEDAEAVAADGSVRRTSLTLPVPFYRYDRERVYGDGALVEEVVRESVSVPWALFSGLLAYLLLVVRWNPENRWALRILRGRREMRRRRRARRGGMRGEETKPDRPGGVRDTARGSP